MDEEAGSEIWRSQLFSDYRKAGKYLLWFGMYIACVPFIIYVILFIGNTKLDVIINIFFLLLIIMGIISFVIIWISMQFLGSYLIIFVNGINIRRPYRFLSQKYIPFKMIQEIKIRELPWYYGNWSLLRGALSRRVKVFKEIIIFIKNQKPFKLTSAWIADIERAKQLLTSNIKVEKISIFNFEKAEMLLSDSEKIERISTVFEKLKSLSTQNKELSGLLPLIMEARKNSSFVEDPPSPRLFRTRLITILEENLIPRKFKKIMRIVFENTPS